MDQVETLLFEVPQGINELNDKQVASLNECLASAVELASHYKSQCILFTHVFAVGTVLHDWLQGTILHNTRSDLVQEQEKQLAQLAKPLIEKGVDVRTVVVWGKNLDDALEAVFDDNLPDLIIQPSHYNFFAAPKIRQPSEWRTIRLPKVPVLLQQRGGPLRGKVVLALDVGEVEISPEENQQLIRQMKQWCQITNSELYLLNAHPSASDFTAFAPPDWTVPQIQSTLQEQHSKRLSRLAQETGIDQSSVFVGEGPVEQVIEVFCYKHDINLVALTSHCRTGVSGFFIGNTAETVLEQTKLNLLVLKPAHE